MAPPRTALARWEILARHIHDGVPLAALAEHSGVSLRTLQRWLACYETGGTAALAASGRSDAGTHRLEPDLVLLVEGLALVRPRASVATITRRATRVATAKGWAAPSYWARRS